MEGLGYAWVALTTTPAIFAAFAGVAWGMLGGALPGISPSITMALLLPFTYTMDPIPAIVLLASTYVGAEYGGSIPAILIRTPGTNAAAATAIDGYEMHLQGKGGEALGLSLVAGVFGGLIGILCLILLTKPLTVVALYFTPPAYFSLGILGLSVIASLSPESITKSLMAGVIGLMIATVGTDPVSGVNRFTYDSPELLDGIPFILVMVGVFAVSELLVQASQKTPQVRTENRQLKIVLPGWARFRKLTKPQLIGSGIGVFEGCMPGAGGTVASFMAYNEARRWSKTPEKFGKGSDEAIVAPEAANNTVAGSAIIPVLSFGIPGSNSSAILLGGLLIHGVQPGPLLFEQHPDVIYGLFSGLLIANFSQLIIGIVLLTPAIWLVNRPKPYLLAAIYALIFSGIYSIDNTLFDLYLVLMAGAIGYVMRRLGFPFLPLVLGLVLGYLIEANYRRSLLLTGGEHRVFIEDPISLGLLITAIILIVGSAMRDRRRSKNKLTE